MRTLLFLAFCLLAFAVCFAAAQRRTGLSLDRDDYVELFQEWKATYGKSYATRDEESRRFGNFIASISRARARNLDYNTDAHGLNPFSDLSTEEFADRFLLKNNVLDDARQSGEFESAQNFTVEEAALMANPRRDSIRTDDGRRSPSPAAYAPNTVYDWGNNGYVSPIKDQAQCGSCWAFSATEQIETNYAMVHGHLPANLSAQQFVDCVTTSYGCNGGFPPNAYTYAKQAGGQQTEASYPYTAQTGTCHATGAKAVQVTGYRVIGQNNEATLMSFLASGGPLSICVDATSMQDYRGGGALLMGNTCSPSNINHCVQVTGFKTDSNGNVQAWNVRNSWGTWWGNKGYVFLQYGVNACGITSYPTAANVA